MDAAAKQCEIMMKRSRFMAIKGKRKKRDRSNRDEFNFKKIKWITVFFALWLI